MLFVQHYDSPLGGILLAADGIGLRGLWFDGQKYLARDLPAERIGQDTPALAEARRWLDIYFAGSQPDFLPPLHPVGTAFRQSVWEILCRFPTEGLRPTARSHGSLLKSRSFPGCLRRRSAVRWVIMRYPSSFPVTVWSAQTAA